MRLRMAALLLALAVLLGLSACRDPEPSEDDLNGPADVEGGDGLSDPEGEDDLNDPADGEDEDGLSDPETGDGTEQTPDGTTPSTPPGDVDFPRVPLD